MNEIQILVFAMPFAVLVLALVVYWLTGIQDRRAQRR